MKRFPAVSVLLAGLVWTWIAAVPARGVEPVPKKAPAETPQAAPHQVIQRLDEALLGTMKQAKELGYSGRYRRLAPVLEWVFDFPGIAALVMGGNWIKLSPAQQRQFIAALRDYSVATYASRFDGYSGERFVIKSTQPLQPNAVVVYSALIQADGKVHSLDYLLRSVSGRWRVVNVLADGVSDLALKRAEFTHLLKLKGFAGLIADLKRSVARMAGRGEKK